MQTGMFARLMGSAAASAPAGAAAPVVTPSAEAAPAGAPAGEMTEARVEAALQAAREEGVAEGRTAGATAERDRTAAVLGSDAGKANMAMAAWMLSSSPSATAESIVKQLETLPAPAAAAAAAEPAKPAAITTPLANAPKLDLAASGAANASSGDGGDAVPPEKIWDGVLADMKNGGGVTSGGAQRGSMN